ncbi:hypothetical protein [Spiroplasma taiwanense]|uniref:Uncharacterized protein n=1 Tax=Spiroplasma taiwanense CT-1 TaxID=1276220 RepID=S5LZW5_9MOLU|nr:hypothetical protein [Spiroplasma taiwanense]AGR41267.1 hypothetical protein STAIW_v1c06490 [Spiroplasma taiwanense CT-1]
MSYCKESFLYLTDLDKKIKEKEVIAKKRKSEFEKKIGAKNYLEEEIEFYKRETQDLEFEIEIIRKIIKDWKLKKEKLLKNNSKEKNNIFKREHKIEGKK